MSVLERLAAMGRFLGKRIVWVWEGALGGGVVREWRGLRDLRACEKQESPGLRWRLAGWILESKYRLLGAALNLAMRTTLLGVMVLMVLWAMALLAAAVTP